MYEHQVWMNGGPGASSLMGFFTELGPLLLNSRSFPGSPGNEGEWQPLKNPYAWSTEASLLVWEQPAGVGFSRCVVPQPCPIWSDTSSAAANLQVLLTFYAVHPAERRRGLIISGESYAGVYVPLLAQQVHEHNGIANARAIRRASWWAIASVWPAAAAWTPSTCSSPCWSRARQVLAAARSLQLALLVRASWITATTFGEC